MPESNRLLRDGGPDINCGFPFQVAFSAAHARLIEVANNYCCAHSMAFRSRWDVRGQLRYCFRAAAFADEFADAFGGERIDFATADRPADLV
jgi:hypothetical protein